MHTRNEHHHARASAQAIPMRTPYHSLGDTANMRVPAWAQHRSVYRAGGRTLYVVETSRLSEAQADLATLDRAGWDVSVTAENRSEGAERARIALTRRDIVAAA